MKTLLIVLLLAQSGSPGADALYKKSYAVFAKGDRAGAFKLLNAAADQGHVEARLGVGRWLVFGVLDGNKDPVRAMDYFRDHVGRHPWATAGMAQALHDAPPPHQDRVKALQLAEQAEVGWQNPGTDFTKTEAHGLAEIIRSDNLARYRAYEASQKPAPKPKPAPPAATTSRFPAGTQFRRKGENFIALQVMSDFGDPYTVHERKPRGKGTYDVSRVTISEKSLESFERVAKPTPFCTKCGGRGDSYLAKGTASGYEWDTDRRVYVGTYDGTYKPCTLCDGSGFDPWSR